MTQVRMIPAADRGRIVTVIDTYQAELIGHSPDGKLVLVEPLHDGAPGGYTILIDADKLLKEGADGPSQP